MYILLQSIFWEIQLEIKDSQYFYEQIVPFKLL